MAHIKKTDNVFYPYSGLQPCLKSLSFKTTSPLPHDGDVNIEDDEGGST